MFSRQSAPEIAEYIAVSVGHHRPGSEFRSLDLDLDVVNGCVFIGRFFDGFWCTIPSLAAMVSHHQASGGPHAPLERLLAPPRHSRLRCDESAAIGIEHHRFRHHRKRGRRICPAADRSDGHDLIDLVGQRSQPIIHADPQGDFCCWDFPPFPATRRYDVPASFGRALLRSFARVR